MRDENLKASCVVIGDCRALMGPRMLPVPGILTVGPGTPRADKIRYGRRFNLKQIRHSNFLDLKSAYRENNYAGRTMIFRNVADDSQLHPPSRDSTTTLKTVFPSSDDRSISGVTYDLRSEPIQPIPILPLLIDASILMSNGPLTPREARSFERNGNVTAKAHCSRGVVTSMGTGPKHDAIIGNYRVGQSKCTGR